MRGADFDRSSASAPDKIAKKLKGAKGQVAVQIWLAKLDAKTAKKVKTELKKECGLTEEEAVEIVNIMPTTLAELRAFTFGWKKLILAETLEKILNIIQGNS